MQRKIFIAIDIDEKAKNFISKKIDKIRDDLSARWIDKENYHITLSFIGYIEDNEMVALGKRVSEVLSDNEMFDIHLNKITLAPNKDNPKMIWLVGEKNQKLIDLRHKIDCIVNDFEIERREFRPHINLGKLKGAKVKTEALESAEKIEKNLDLIIPVTGIKLFESRIEKRRQRYFTIESIEFN